MDIRKVKKLIDLLEESGISEIEIKEGEESVRISRGSTFAPPQAYYAAPPPMPAAPATLASSNVPATATAVRNEHVVTAPMVGTFYSAPTPGAKSYVGIGDQVKVGQTLCIIEAMKMMNQIECDKAGKITSVMAQNGDPVEFGQPLFVIE